MIHICKAFILEQHTQKDTNKCHCPAFASFQELNFRVWISGTTNRFKRCLLFQGIRKQSTVSLALIKFVFPLCQQFLIRIVDGSQAIFLHERNGIAL